MTRYDWFITKDTSQKQPKENDARPGAGKGVLGARTSSPGVRTLDSLQKPSARVSAKAPLCGCDHGEELNLQPLPGV